jgi:hypothetical protein
MARIPTLRHRRLRPVIFLTKLSSQLADFAPPPFCCPKHYNMTRPARHVERKSKASTPDGAGTPPIRGREAPDIPQGNGYRALKVGRYQPSFEARAVSLRIGQRASAEARENTRRSPLMSNSYDRGE